MEELESSRIIFLLKLISSVESLLRLLMLRRILKRTSLKRKSNEDLEEKKEKIDLEELKTVRKDLEEIVMKEEKIDLEEIKTVRKDLEEILMKEAIMFLCKIISKTPHNLSVAVLKDWTDAVPTQ